MEEPHPRPELELRLLWYFLAVADELSFSRAAVRVGIAQPPLSQQIQKLEAILGCALFDRGGRRVQLTTAGALLVTEARRLLADANHAAELLRRAGRGETGSLTIGFLPSTLFSPLPAAVRRFHDRFPGVGVRLRELFSSDGLDRVRAGTVDMAILREPAPAADIVALPVLVEPFVAVVPADHRFSKRRAIAAALLRDEPFVLFPRESVPVLHTQVLGLCRAAGFEPRVVQEVDAWHTIISLVEAGIGVSLIPASFEGRRTGALAYVPLTGPQVHTTTMACVRATGRARPTDAFLDVLRATCRTSGPPRAGRGRSSP